MKIAKFEIANFKGIQRTDIALASGSPGNVITLIGLNESGKTTILEAISYFATEDKETASLVKTVQNRPAIQDLIPKDRKAAFTGNIVIAADIVVEDADIKSLSEFFQNNHNLHLDKGDMARTIKVSSIYKFEDSAPVGESQTFWVVNFPLRAPRAKKNRVYNHEGDTRAIWIAGVGHLRKLIPEIVYFPTFLFNFPDRIYLDNTEALEGPQAKETNEYYKKIIQDVLDSQGEGLSIQKHVVDRINKRRSSFPTPATFIAHFFGLDEKSQIDSLMQKASNEMSRIIFGAWSEILGKNVSNKRVQIDWLLDSEHDNASYIQMSIIDGQSRYALSERSLGFRWFFSFLLFTQFRKNRKNGNDIIFLFDEPAANLHSKAQIRLLESFSRIARDSTYIIYSTHSHYMVNPLWLEKAYIVENKAIDYEDEDQVDSFSIKKTDISATKYRTFVGKHPTKTTYFQPVLDALDVSYSPMEQAAKAIIIEGKFDYHPFVYLYGRTTKKYLPGIFPANGAGGMGTLINLFRGWGVEFCIILDDDTAGKIAKARYLEEFLLQEDQAATLGDIDDRLKGKSFEGIYQTDTRDAVKSLYNIEKIKKDHFSLYFQEQLSNPSNTRLSDTEEMFSSIAKWAELKLKL